MRKSFRRLTAVAIVLALAGVGAVYGTAAMHSVGHKHARVARSCWEQRLTPRRILLLRRGPLNDAAARRVICGGVPPLSRGARR